jgi:tRNA 2-thiocytidine biosynthesis protein TtcA
MTGYRKGHKSDQNKLQQRLQREVGRAVHDFNMIEDGDRVMVCVSGGKDSYTLLDILLNLQRHAPVHFEILAVNLDQQQPGFPAEVLPNYFDRIGIPYRIIAEDTYSLVREIVPEGKTYCGWCSRFRRGILYKFARNEGYDKIALGHHRDDIVETLFLNMFYGGKLKAMPAKLLSDDGTNVVIRPLAYCREKDIASYAQLKEFPIIPCNLCGPQENPQRQVIKEMPSRWDKEYPGRIETMFRSLTDLVPSHLLDTSAFNFGDIGRKDVGGEQYLANDADVQSSFRTVSE